MANNRNCFTCGTRCTQTFSGPVGPVGPRGPQGLVGAQGPVGQTGSAGIISDYATFRTTSSVPVLPNQPMINWASNEVVNGSSIQHLLGASQIVLLKDGNYFMSYALELLTATAQSCTVTVLKNGMPIDSATVLLQANLPQTISRQFISSFFSGATITVTINSGIIDVSNAVINIMQLSQ